MEFLIQREAFAFFFNIDQITGFEVTKLLIQMQQVQKNSRVFS